MFDENAKDPGLQAGRRAWALVALLMVLAIVALVTLTAR
jgi:hypothetical protein